MTDDLAITLGHRDKKNALQEYGLCGRRIAYLQGEGNKSHAIVVYDLVSGSEARVYGAAREQISALALSHEILAYVNRSSQLYVIDLTDAARSRSIPLPSFHIQAMVADGSMIGVLLVNPLMDALDTNKATFVLYDYFANSTTSFSFAYQGDDHPYHSYIHPQMLLLNSKAKIVDVFGPALAQSVDPETPDHEMTRFGVGRTRFSTNGAMLHSSIETWLGNLHEANISVIA